MPNIYRLKVDLKLKQTGIVPTFVQYDSARLEFQIFDGGQLFDLSGYTSVEFAHKKPDGSVLVGNGVIETDAKGNKIVAYDYQGSEMNAAGVVETSFSLIGADNKKISIQTFRVSIVKDLRDDVLSPTNPEYSKLQEYSVQMETIIADADSATANAREMKLAGAYNSTVAYKKNNTVTFNGESYMAKQAVTGIAPTGQATDPNWIILARKGADGTGTVIRHREEFIATAGQTVFNLQNSYDQYQNRIDVSVGNVPQFSPDNFQETTATRITLTEGASAGDKVIVTYFSQAQPIASDLNTKVEGHNTQLSNNNILLADHTNKINDVTVKLADKASKAELANALDGSPKGTYETLADLQAAYPSGTEGVYIVTANGHIYTWDGVMWADRGVYQSAGIADGSVSYTKQRFLSVDGIETNPDVAVLKEIFVNGDTLFSNMWMSYITGTLSTEASQRSIVYELPKDFEEITIRTQGTHNRFVVGLVPALSSGTTGEVLYAGENGDGLSSGNETYTVISGGVYKYLIIGLTTAGEKIPVTLEVKNRVGLATNQSIEYPKITKNDDSAKIKFSETKVDGFGYYANKWFNYATLAIFDDTKPRSVVYEIPANAIVKVQTFGIHNRFVIGLTNDIVAGSKGVAVYTGVNGDGLSSGNETYTLKNQNYKYLVVGISSSGTKVPITLTIIDEVDLAPARSLNQSSLIGAGIDKKKEIYPVLFGVKMSNEKDISTGNPGIPRPLGWLYYVPQEPYEILYASGSPENMRHLCYWKKEVTWDGFSTPEQYRPFITKDGDIIFVWRGDLLGTGSTHTDSRQNPIIYPAGDWNNPISVDLGTNLKPTSWLQNCGADFLYNDDVFVFSEYTRPHHETANVWRVTKPFSNPANWTTTQSFVLSGSNETGMKHCHTVQYDTFSGKTYMTTGDDDSASKIFVSNDKGLTWAVVYEGNRKYARVLNFVFAEEGAYWANDDGLHSFNFAPRVGGIVDFTQISELYDLMGHPPTYVNVLVDKPYGVLLLHRFDGVITDSTLTVHFWDIATSTMHVVAEIKPVDENVLYGFRVEAINFYQSRGNNSIVVGLANPYNNMDLLNNAGSTNSERINNLVLKVIRDGATFKLEVSAIQDRT